MLPCGNHSANSNGGNNAKKFAPNTSSQNSQHLSQNLKHLWDKISHLVLKNKQDRQETFHGAASVAICAHNTCNRVRQAMLKVGLRGFSNRFDQIGQTLQKNSIVWQNIAIGRCEGPHNSFVANSFSPFVNLFSNSEQSIEDGFYERCQVVVLRIREIDRLL
jgi:hypothetical protein